MGGAVHSSQTLSRQMAWNAFSVDSKIAVHCSITSDTPPTAPLHPLAKSRNVLHSKGKKREIATSALKNSPETANDIGLSLTRADSVCKSYFTLLGWLIWQFINTGIRPQTVAATLLYEWNLTLYSVEKRKIILALCKDILRLTFCLSHLQIYDKTRSKNINKHCLKNMLESSEHSIRYDCT